MSNTVTLDEITPLTAKIDRLVESMQKGDAGARKELLIAARSLYLAVETPMEALLRMYWAETYLLAAVRIAVDLNLFEHLASNGGEPKRTSQLAKATGAEPELLERILKHLAAMGVIHEVDAALYESTYLSKALTEPRSTAAVYFGFDMMLNSLQALPQYLAAIGYRNPWDQNRTAFSTGHGTKLDWWGWLQENTDKGEQFNNHMAGYATSRMRWMGPNAVPVRQVLSTEGHEVGSDVLLVDVGGGIGHDLALFKEHYPDLPGRLILQELPAVVESCKSKLPTEIEAMEYDFFTTQPIKGARAYYFHSIFHDWSDDNCREILKNLIPAMTRGYSKILLNENVVSKRDAFWETTGLDLVMMTVFSSHERTEDQWHELLQSVGLRVIKIWTYEKGSESLIEIELE